MASRHDIENRQHGAFDRLLSATRLLLLHVPARREVAFVEWVDDELTARGVPDDGKAAWLERVVDALDEAIDARVALPPAADQVLRLILRAIAGPPGFVFEDSTGLAAQDVARAFSDRFAEKLKGLARMHGSSSNQARVMLWHAPECCRLYASGLSFSEISRRMEGISQDVPFTSEVVKRITTGLHLAVPLNPEMFSELLTTDDQAQDWRLADAGLDDAIQIASEIALRAGYSGKLESHLKTMLREPLSHPPFLVILHFQLATVEFRDHAPTFGYEYSPRGQNLRPFKERYEQAGLMPGREPFLDNAKSVQRFDVAWAQSKDNPDPATAMVSILQELEDMPYPARRDVAAQIRSVLMRNLSLNTEANVADPTRTDLESLSVVQLQALAMAIGNRNTNTAGLLEQRLVDAYAAMSCPAADGWVHHGFGDPIFAPNRYRKKFGDCEAMKNTGGQLAIHGYESHGGTLTEEYVQDHLRTLRLVMAERGPLLEAMRPDSDWDLKVVFVAHELLLPLPDSAPALPTTATFIYMTIGAAAAALSANPIGDVLMRRYLIAPLLSAGVRSSVRRKALALI
jgi:hypothetical protein